jgi:hypothetical protein
MKFRQTFSCCRDFFYCGVHAMKALGSFTEIFVCTRPVDFRMSIDGLASVVTYGVVFDQPTITTTLRALGLPVRAPPIAPAHSRQLLDCDNSNDWAGGDVDYCWPD